VNFLAHLWLADRSRTSLAGSILGDVVRGRELSTFPDEIAHGIRLHRRVDALSDRHPDLQTLRAAFGGCRRYAGIVLDLAGDHALWLDWPDDGGESRDDFCARAAAAVAAASPWFVRAGGRATTTMEFAALLRSYGSEAGIDRAVRRVARRLREPAPLLDAARDWRGHLPALRSVLPGVLGDLLRTMNETSAADRSRLASP
jgi:acyl carrier protein phosphodiesterase